MTRFFLFLFCFYLSYEILWLISGISSRLHWFECLLVIIETFKYVIISSATAYPFFYSIIWYWNTWTVFNIYLRCIFIKFHQQQKQQNTTGILTGNLEVFHSGAWNASLSQHFFFVTKVCSFSSQQINIFPDVYHQLFYYVFTCFSAVVYWNIVFLYQIGVSHFAKLLYWHFIAFYLIILGFKGRNLIICK